MHRATFSLQASVTSEPASYEVEAMLYTDNSERAMPQQYDDTGIGMICRNRYPTVITELLLIESRFSAKAKLIQVFQS